MTKVLQWTDATVDIGVVPAGGMSVHLVAGAEDRRAIADRLQLPAVEECAAAFALRPEPGHCGTLVEGRLSARLVRRCVVTDDPVAEAIDQPVECLVVAEEPAARDDRASEPDYEVAPDDIVDLAELAVQLLSVSMATYPRGPGADQALASFRAGESAAGDRDNPFSCLGLRLAVATASPNDTEGEDGGA